MGRKGIKHRMLIIVEEKSILKIYEKFYYKSNWLEQEMPRGRSKSKFFFGLRFSEKIEVIPNVINLHISKKMKNV